MNTLYYIHDPMCSWCYAFRDTLAALSEQLSERVNLVWRVGGLAEDSDLVMPEVLQQQIEATWHRIEEKVPGVEFNFDFWRLCTPRRSTYPACRAVIVARELGGAEMERAMTRAIQDGYYRQARNPSDIGQLLEMATEIGIDTQRFDGLLRSDAIDRQLQREIAGVRAMGVNSFPSLLLDIDGSRWPVAIDYRKPQAIIETVEQLLEF